MQWAKDAEFLEAIAREEGVMPPALLSKPDLDQVEQFYYEIFWMLHTTRRSSTDGMDPIQPSEILAIAQLLGVKGPEELEDLFATITSMDRHLRKTHQEKKKAAEPPKPAPGTNNGSRSSRHTAPKH